MPPHAGISQLTPAKTREAHVLISRDPVNSTIPRKLRPTPWNWIPDDVTAALTLVMVIPIVIPMAILISSSNLFWEVCKFVHRTCKLQFINDAVMSGAKKLGPHMLVDSRDYSYIPWVLFLSTFIPSLFAWAAYRHVTYGFEWTTFILYHFWRIGPRFRFFAHAHVLFHKEGHSKVGIFKGPFRVLNGICQWFIGPFFGQVPMSYAAGHNKIHHRFDNGLDDAHTNLDLDRTKLSSLFVYIPRFAGYWSGLSCTGFFLARREWALARMMGLGMCMYHTILFGTMAWNFSFGLAYLVYPYCESILFFSLISYLWHAWVDPENPDNQYVNSVTILNGRDNIWNEDYHVVHHCSPCHWSEYPAHYQKNLQSYIDSKATIFQDTEEGEMLYWLLSGRWDDLTNHFVDLTGKMTHEEKKELLMLRLRATLCYDPAYRKEDAVKVEEAGKENLKKME